MGHVTFPTRQDKEKPQAWSPTPPPKHASIPCFARGRMGRSILTLLRGCAPLVLGDTCPVWCPKVFRVLRPNCSSQEHHQQTAETSFPLIPLSIHLSNVLLFKQSQAAQEVHAQPTAFRRASSKFSPFFISLWPHFPSLIFLPYVENCYGTQNARGSSALAVKTDAFLIVHLSGIIGWTKAHIK